MKINRTRRLFSLYAGKRSFLYAAALMVINLLLDLVIPMPFTRMPVREYYVMMFLDILPFSREIGTLEQPPFNTEHYENLHEKQELLSFCV